MVTVVAYGGERVNSIFADPVDFLVWDGHFVLQVVRKFGMIS